MNDCLDIPNNINEFNPAAVHLQISGDSENECSSDFINTPSELFSSSEEISVDSRSCSEDNKTSRLPMNFPYRQSKPNHEKQQRRQLSESEGEGEDEIRTDKKITTLTISSPSHKHERPQTFNDKLNNKRRTVILNSTVENRDISRQKEHEARDQERDEFDSAMRNMFLSSDSEILNRNDDNSYKSSSCRVQNISSSVSVSQQNSKMNGSTTKLLKSKMSPIHEELDSSLQTTSDSESGTFTSNNARQIVPLQTSRKRKNNSSRNKSNGKISHQLRNHRKSRERNRSNNKNNSTQLNSGSPRRLETICNFLSDISWSDIQSAAMISPFVATALVFFGCISIVCLSFAFVFIIPIAWIIIVMYIIVPDSLRRFKEKIFGWLQILLDFPKWCRFLINQIKLFRFFR